MGKGRFAPSPTGRMHLGNIYSALIAWASCRSAGDGFIVRMEDIDGRCRGVEAKDLILDDLSWLGIDWDGTPVNQSERSEAYAAALEQIKERAHVYPCFCSRSELHAASAPHASDGTPIYAGTCRHLTEAEIHEKALKRNPAIRVSVPDTTITFEDRCLGRLEQNLAAECGDFLLRRSDGVFAYQLVVVVDDFASGVTQVVRGGDLASSVPRQMWLYGLLDAPVPDYGHHPVLLAPDGKRLSKREKSLDMGSLRSLFAKPEELVGWLAVLSGQIDAYEEMSASDYARIFKWEKVPTEDIVLEPFGPVSSIF